MHWPLSHHPREWCTSAAIGTYQYFRDIQALALLRHVYRSPRGEGGWDSEGRMGSARRWDEAPRENCSTAPPDPTSCLSKIRASLQKLLADGECVDRSRALVVLRQRTSGPCGPASNPFHPLTSRSALLQVCSALSSGRSREGSRASVETSWRVDVGRTSSVGPRHSRSDADR